LPFIQLAVPPATAVCEYAPLEGFTETEAMSTTTPFGFLIEITLPVFPLGAGETTPETTIV
jgi:hypothetical protein